MADKPFMWGDDFFPITPEEEYEYELRQEIKGALSHYAQVLEWYGISASLEDGSTNMDWYEDLYGAEVVAAHRNHAKRIKRREKSITVFAERHRNAEYLEKIIPITLTKSTEQFIEEISNENIDTFYHKYNFTPQEQDIFHQMRALVPAEVVIQISAMYDDVIHGIDFSIVGDFPLCGVDITTDVELQGEHFVTSEMKRDKSRQRNESDVSMFYGIAYDENSNKYIPQPSIANFPHLCVSFPNSCVQRTIKGLDLSKEYSTKDDFLFAREVIRGLSVALDATESKIRFKGVENFGEIGGYVHSAERTLSLPQGGMTIVDKGNQALAERLKRIKILHAFFYCIDQFFSKKTSAEPQVGVPYFLLRKGG